jgi:hypothetical protein
MMRRLTTGRNLADLLTVSRALLGLGLAWLGFKVGARALPAALLILVLSWFTDLLDGPVARRDTTSPLTWVGRHDAEADLSASLGVVAYLVLSGYMAGWLGVLTIVATLALWVLHSRQLAWPLYATPYGVLVFVALRKVPVLGWLAVAYLLLTLAVRWPRLRSEYLPEFFQAVGGLRERGSH